VFFWLEDVKPSEIHRIMLVQYGEHCIVQKNVYSRFKHRRKALNDDERLGWPSTSQTDDHHAEVDTLIQENRQITVSEIA
jgi:hypothetical protein